MSFWWYVLGYCVGAIITGACIVYYDPKKTFWNGTDGPSGSAATILWPLVMVCLVIILPVFFVDDTVRAHGLARLKRLELVEQEKIRMAKELAAIEHEIDKSLEPTHGRH
jgi:hypothetical protein